MGPLRGSLFFRYLGRMSYTISQETLPINVDGVTTKQTRFVLYFLDNGENVRVSEFLTQSDAEDARDAHIDELNA